MDFLGIFFTVIGLLLLLVFLRFFFQVLWPVIRQVRALHKAQKELFRQADGTDSSRAYRYRHQERREGEVTVERISGNTRTIIRDEIGETVDYEEVE